MEYVNLSDIEYVSKDELSDAKLKALENSYDSFETQLNSSSNPIALDKGRGKPYGILNGRHRVWLARHKGYDEVPAIFA